MKFEIRGALQQVFETKQVSDRFTKREFVLDVPDGRYSQMLMFELTGDRCSQLDGLSAGDPVTVDFSLRGREWRSPSGQVKYFNTLSAFKVTPTNAAETGPPQNGQPQTSSSRAVTAAGAQGDDGDDGIPF